MSIRSRAWYPALAGLLVLAVWLVAAALFEFPTWRVALLVGLLGGAVTAWTERLRRDRLLRGQREQDMGFDYRA